MNQKLKDSISSYIQTYQEELELKQQERDGKFDHIPYGTAGFRGEARQIEHLFFNIGIISGLRALNLNANVGVMITASHNPIQDNGVKLIDSQGEMLHPDWETIAETFSNNQSTEGRIEMLDELVKKYNIDLITNRSIHVCIGMDTRPSSEALASLIKRGLDVWSDLIDYYDYGIVTTPALHYLVGKSNRELDCALLNIRDYYNLLIKALTNSGFVYRETDQALCVDCANGVGAETMNFLINEPQFRKLFPKLSLINTGSGTLNKDCGADFVKSQVKPPAEANQPNTRYASLDGDADRLVYFYLQSTNDNKDIDQSFKLHLLDGDRILSLYAIYLKSQLEQCHLSDKMSFAIIQTPYANGASTNYLKQILGLKVDFTDTGVKNLHKQALDYDLAVYFEANGHGTIHVSDKAKLIIQDECEKNQDTNCATLEHLLNTINNYTGDAISDMILVEIILQHFNWNIEQWHKMYQERPNSLIKSEVPDKNLIKTTNAGQNCVAPEGLQQAIDDIVSEYGQVARCFVRPSGTENVVRIYAEAETQDLSDELANKVKACITKILAN